MNEVGRRRANSLTEEEDGSFQGDCELFTKAASASVSKGKTMTAWRMTFRAGKNGHEMWPDCYEHGVAAIGYGPVDDIDFSLLPKGELTETWTQLAPTQKASLNRLVYEMQRGDVIYVKEGPLIVGKGVVSGPYQFDMNSQIREPNGEYWQHQRPVSWTPNFPKVRIQVGRNQRLVVEVLKPEDVSSIEQKTGRSWLPAEEADESETIDDPSYVAQDGDRREIILRQIRERRGQQQFRDELRKQYFDRCLVTGCKVAAVLEAAHIDPYRSEDNNHQENGLLLRADIHTLFDLDLLGIEPNSLRVEIHQGITEEYGNLVGKTLGCAGNLRPSPVALRRRYEQFQKRAQQPE